MPPIEHPSAPFAPLPPGSAPRARRRGPAWLPLRRGIAAACCAVLVACAGEPVQQQFSADPVDMRGHWELDYGSSDNLQSRYNSLVRDLRQRQARSAAAAERGVVVSSGGSQEALIGLAQMAELVTQAQLLEIDQDRVSIRVEREGSFALGCDYGDGGNQQRQDYGVGAERCFWDGQQLVFEIRLPEGLDIVHRLSVADSGKVLAIVTSLYSSSVATPFTLRRIYRRYDPGSSPYRCTETLTRGRVCTTTSS